LRELTDLCQAATDKSIEIGQDDTVRYGDVPLYITDTRRIAENLGWQPEYSVEQVVEDTAAWIKDNEELLRPVFTRK